MENNKRIKKEQTKIKLQIKIKLRFKTNKIIQIITRLVILQQQNKTTNKTNLQIPTLNYLQVQFLFDPTRHPPGLYP